VKALVPNRIRILAALPLLLGLSAPRVASACSGAYCARPVSLVLPQSGVVPANLGELTTYEPGPPWYPAEADVRVWDASDPSRVLYRGSAHVTPIGPLIEGKTYVAEVTPNCGWAEAEDKVPEQYSFRVGPASDAPTSLGALKVVRTGSASVPWGGGTGCWEDFKAASAELQLDPASLPEAWRELLTEYQLMVDDEPFSWPLTTGGGYGSKEWPRGSYIGHPGAFQVWTACGPVPMSPTNLSEIPSQATPGKHTVWVRARLPSTQPKFLESERVQVELACAVVAPLPEQSPPDLVAPDAGQTPDASQTTNQDGGEPPADDTEEEPGEMGDALDEEPPAHTSRIDGGCSVRPGTTPSTWGLLAALGLTALLRRTRARKRSPAPH
jgi:MYXO-CTERM domain-containing protein